MAYSVYLDIIFTGRHFAFDIKYPTLSSWNIPGGYFLPTCWIPPAYLLDTSCLLVGYLLPTSWILPAYLLDTSYLLVGYFLPTSWIPPAYLLGTLSIYSPRHISSKLLYQPFFLHDSLVEIFITLIRLHPQSCPHYIIYAKNESSPDGIWSLGIAPISAGTTEDGVVSMMGCNPPLGKIGLPSLSTCSSLAGMR